MNFIKSIVTVLSLCASASVFAGSFNLDKEHVPGELIVKFKDGRLKSNKDLLNALGGSIKYSFKTRGAQVVTFAQAKSKDQLLETAKRLMARDDVEYVEANTILHVNRVPNDADFAKQYGMKNTGLNGGTINADIHAAEAWDKNTGSKDVVVGVIDTGIDYDHPDIAPNYWTNPGESGKDANGNDKRSNGIDDDGNGYIDDYRGWNFVANTNDPMDDNHHGTHCAGVIGAHGNDGKGVTGVNWDVSLVGIKFLSGSGSGSLEDAVKAIEYATKLGLSLTSNSWGGGGFSQTMQDAIKNAGDHGILFIAAAGNDGDDNDVTPHFPSTYNLPNIIAVAASDNKDQMASFSNSGINTVHVAAPGVDIYSSIPEGKYDTMSGTSMATPHVAGLAALVKAAIPSATMAQVRKRIMYGVDKSDYWSTRVASGGRINAAKAIKIDSIPPSSVRDVRVASSTIASVTFEWTHSGDDQNEGSASTYEVRTSATPILTDSDWQKATPVSLKFSSAGSMIRGTLEFSDFNQKGFVAVRAYDSVGNESVAGSSVEFSTRSINKFYERTATSLDGFKVDAPWSIEKLADGTSVFSDSPGENYKDNVNVSMTTAAIAIPSSDLAVSLELKYDLESTYDFLHVEVSNDEGASWKEMAAYSGTIDTFTRKVINLNTLNFSGNIQLRFRLQSDSSTTKGGAWINNISVVAPN